MANRDLDDKKLAYVSRLASEVDNLLKCFERLDVLANEGVRLDYGNTTTGITASVLDNSEYNYVTPAQIVDAVVQYNNLKAQLTPTIQTALLRLRP